MLFDTIKNWSKPQKNLNAIALSYKIVILFDTAPSTVAAAYSMALSKCNVKYFTR
jgi:hypothetical protein